MTRATREEAAAAAVESGEQPIAIGRYVLHGEIARGGMATIHIARLMGDEGFDRIVAAKRLHPELADNAEFVSMFLDEARIASKVRHRNVVPVLDVVASGREVILVQEYVHGVPLHLLLRSLWEAHCQVPIQIAAAIACQLLAGLHATHEAADELGTPLHIVHRDVSPQNVLLAVDGTVRLLDFGVAQTGVARGVPEPTYKGKLAYSAPEHLQGAATRQSDIYSLSVLLWEMIVGRRMHRRTQAHAELVTAILNGALPTIEEALSTVRAGGAIDDEAWSQIMRIDAVVRKGLAADARDRWTDAAEMEEALSAAVPPAPAGAVAAWLRTVAWVFIEERDRLIADEETSWRRARTAGDEATAYASLEKSSTRLRARELLAQLGVGVEAPREPPAVPAAARRAPRSRALVHGLIGAALATGVAVGLTSLAPVASQPAAHARAARRSKPVRSSTASEPTLRAGAMAAPSSDVGFVGPPSKVAARADRATATLRGVTAPAVAPKPRMQESERPARTSAPAVPGEAAQGPVDAPEEASPAVRGQARWTRAEHECDPPYYLEGVKKIFKPACF